MTNGDTTKTPSRLSISKAAKLAGKSRQTLYEDRDNGRLSIERDERNKPYIEVVELERVYGKLDNSQLSGSDKKRQMATDENGSQDRDLQAEIDLLNERLKHANALLSRSESERDKWEEAFKKQQELAANVTRVLEDQRPKADQVKESPPPRGWLRRVIGI